MRVAITGGTGFVGAQLAGRLKADGKTGVLISGGREVREMKIRRLPGVVVAATELGDARRLEEAMAGCGAVAHCAGINREIGGQTYQAVHIDGTAHVVEAARKAGVRKMAFMSFLRARPNCASGYHESKWAA